MGDVTCAKCGEPWDSFGARTGDSMTAEEYRGFMRGEGCPCCDFGKKLNYLSGSTKPDALESAHIQSALDSENTDDPDRTLQQLGLD